MDNGPHRGGFLLVSGKSARLVPIPIRGKQEESSGVRFPTSPESIVVWGLFQSWVITPVASQNEKLGELHT